jgi:hypothetical protein
MEIVLGIASFVLVALFTIAYKDFAGFKRLEAASHIPLLCLAAFGAGIMAGGLLAGYKLVDGEIILVGMGVMLTAMAVHYLFPILLWLRGDEGE